jgi:hypothetical protein
MVKADPYMLAVLLEDVDRLADVIVAAVGVEQSASPDGRRGFHSRVVVAAALTTAAQRLDGIRGGLDTGLYVTEGVSGFLKRACAGLDSIDAGPQSDRAGGLPSRAQDRRRQD